MSLEGTRPPTVDEWEKYELHHRARLAAKPGLTGMWQVSGRSNITDFEEVVELDREYISHWSMENIRNICIKKEGRRMTIIVTGGAGFIGSNFVFHMLDKYPDYRIVCVDKLTYAGNLSTLAPVMDNPNFRLGYCRKRKNKIRNRGQLSEH